MQNILLLVLFTYAWPNVDSNAVCHHFPRATPSKNIHINVAGNPHKFVPGSIYSIRIRAKSSFTRFMVTADSGSFEINDRTATFSEECVNTVVETHSKPKHELNLVWAAPMTQHVEIQVGLQIENKWEMSVLSMTGIDTSSNGKSQNECCACDHAKYKVVFQGLWSRERHPRDFPVTSQFTHFSDVIGATHDSNYSMWGEGQYATYGFKQLAEYGVVRELETELKNSSKHLRSIVRATGLWYPQVTSNTTAVFLADPRHNLLSLVSMFGPSPDWVVGISSLNLCLPNCSWVEDMVIELYPYDAGTDDGYSYLSLKSATTPQEKIRRITTMYPEDPRGPFYNPSSDSMPSLATLRITQERLIPKLCSDLTETEILQKISLTENTEDAERRGCEVTTYSGWSPCTVSCGKGIRIRTRTYINSTLAQQIKCDRQLISREMCVADHQCPGEEDLEEIKRFAAGECDVSGWSEWSDCSVTCGIGFKIRTRSFLSNHELVNKKCMAISTMEKEKCMGPVCRPDGKKVPQACNTTEWSEWSPCSKSCGSGTMTRIRQFQSERPPKYCLKSVLLRETLNCTQSLSCEINSVDAQRICLLPYVAGPCRGSFIRYTYLAAEQKCGQFYFGGCRGNRNNFLTLEECNKTCHGISVPQNDSPKHCIVSKWSEWSPCTPCVNGTKTKTRAVLQEPQNGGRSCPKLVKTMSCSTPPEFCNA